MDTIGECQMVGSVNHAQVGVLPAVRLELVKHALRITTFFKVTA